MRDSFAVHTKTLKIARWSRMAFKELPVLSKYDEEADPSELRVLSMKPFQVIVICCGL
jgi:hypothetical protein